MRKIVAALLVALSWSGSAFGYTGSGSVWRMPTGSFVATNYTGTTAGVAAADASFFLPTLPTTGLTQLGPGTEGLTLPAYIPGHCFLWARYDAWRVVGTPFESWPAGVRQMRVDSTGVHADSVLTTPRFGPASGFNSGGAIRIVDGVKFAQSFAGIHAAVQDLPVEGGTVVLPGGTYAGTGTLNITGKTSVWLVGTGPRKTILSTSISSGPGILAANPSTRFVKLSGLSLNQSGGSLPGSQIAGNYGIRDSAGIGFQLVLDHVEVQFFANSALFIEGATGPWQVRDCSFQHNAGYGVETAVQGGQTPEDGAVSGGNIQDCWGGLLLADAFSFHGLDTDIELGDNGRYPCVYVKNNGGSCSFTNITSSIGSGATTTPNGVWALEAGANGCTFVGGINYANNGANNIYIRGANSQFNTFIGGYFNNKSTSGGYFADISSSNRNVFVAPYLNIPTFTTGKDMVNETGLSQYTTAISVKTSDRAASNIGIATSMGAFDSLRVLPITFANLGTPVNGSIAYCSDCTAASPTAAGGTGNTVLRENGAWNAARSGTGTGETNTASNVGSGSGVFKQKTGVNLEFKSLVGSASVAIANNTNDLTFTATGDTTGLAYMPGRLNGQTIVGSTRTAFNTNSFLALRGFTSTTASSQLLLNSDATLTADNLNLASEGQTTGLNCHFGIGFTNTENTGSLTLWGPGGNGSISGGAALRVQNGTGSSITSPTSVFRAMTSQTGPLSEWRSVSDGVLARVDVNGNFTGGLAPSGNIQALQGTDIASAASITLPTGNAFRITGVADINAFSPRPDGTEIVLLFTGAAATNGVVDDDAGLDLNGNLLYLPGTVLILKRISGAWHEGHRSFN